MFAAAIKKQCHSERSGAQAARREESLIFLNGDDARRTPPLSNISGETNTQKQAQKRRRDGGLKIRDSSLRSE
jgi:hypothetical protein